MNGTLAMAALEVERVLGPKVEIVQVNKTDGTIIMPEDIIQALA